MKRDSQGSTIFLGLIRTYERNKYGKPILIEHIDLLVVLSCVWSYSRATACLVGGYSRRTIGSLSRSLHQAPVKTPEDRATLFFFSS
jgi:hypothetical protein